MSITVLSGVASNVTLGSDYSYMATAQHGPVAIKNQIVSMRLDSKPVLFRTRTLPSISDGDNVAAAGSMKNGTLEAIALRNLTTGSAYHPGTNMVMVGAGLLIILGIPLIAFIGFGFLFIGVGVWAMMKALNVRKAVAQLSQQAGGAVA